MFLDFYDLIEQPFGVTPNPRYFYGSEIHREALASLTCGIRYQVGFAVLISPPGMGKTSLLFQLLERYRSSAHTVFLFNTQCTTRTLLQEITDELHIEASSVEVAKLLSEFHCFVAKAATESKPVLIIVDEAQNLPYSALETLRLLSNFETPERKLLHIILAGQPELSSKLQQPRLFQLLQRITIVTRLQKFSTEQTKDYIRHRLRVAGYTRPELFSPEALAHIARHGGGVPREINRICFNALLNGFARRKRTIDEAIVSEVISDLDLRKTDGNEAAMDEAKSASATNVTQVNFLPFAEAPSAGAAAQGLMGSKLARHAATAPSLNLMNISIGQFTGSTAVVPGLQPDAQGSGTAVVPQHQEAASQAASLLWRSKPVLRKLGERRWATWMLACSVVIVTTGSGLVLANRSWLAHQFFPDRAVVHASMPVQGTPPATAPDREIVSDNEGSQLSSRQQEKSSGLQPVNSAEEKDATRAWLASPNELTPGSFSSLAAHGRDTSQRHFPGQQPLITARGATSAGVYERSASAKKDGVEDPPPPHVPGIETKSAPPIFAPGNPAIPKLTYSTPAELVEAVDPAYPSAARASRMQGDVLLAVSVGADGRVARIRATKGNPVLAASAMAAVKQWRYRPRIENGQPQESQLNVRVVFRVPE